jgi:hypothetical protein
VAGQGCITPRRDLAKQAVLIVDHVHVEQVVVQATLAKLLAGLLAGAAGVHGGLDRHHRGGHGTGKVDRLHASGS